MKRFFVWITSICIVLSGCTTPKGSYELSTQRIQSDTEYLCNEIGDRPTGTDKERAACDWLEQQLEAAGFSSQAGTLKRTGFQGLFDLTSENLVAVCNPGADGPILCAMAHYDSVEGSPGARDNAASVAVLLELGERNRRRTWNRSSPYAGCKGRTDGNTFCSHKGMSGSREL